MGLWFGVDLVGLCRMKKGKIRCRRVVAYCFGIVRGFGVFSGVRGFGGVWAFGCVLGIGEFQRLGGGGRTGLGLI